MTTRMTSSDTTHQDSDRSVEYFHYGAKFLLPNWYQVQESNLPEWRLAHFALIIPMPTGLVDTPPQGTWIPGRFRGIKTIEVPARKKETDLFLKPTALLDEERDEPAYFYAPRAFHVDAHTHFRAPLRDSIGADAVDGGLIRSDWQKVPRTANNDVTFEASRCMFQPDITQDANSSGQQVPPPQDPRQSEKEGHFLYLEDGDNNAAKVTLACAEILNYCGPKLRDLSTDINRQGQLPNFENQFLVLHVVAENCSSAMLEKISKSLHKPRNKVTYRIPESEYGDVLQSLLPNAAQESSVTAEESTTRTGKTSLIQLFLQRVEMELLGARYSPKNPKLKMAAGGFLHRSDKSPISASNRVFAVTTAIPGRDTFQLASRFRQTTAEERQNWTAHDTWGWFLANRADQFKPELTALDDESLDESRVQLYHDWALHSSENGLAVIRRRPADNRNNSFWMYAGTRFVDLAILVRRADGYLTRMAKQLRAMTFKSEELNALLNQCDDEGPDEPLTRAQEILQTSLQNFEILQTEFVTFRDHLWYESVSGRDVDTKVLRSILVSTGAHNDFTEVSSELQLRESIYRTQGDSIRFALKEQQQKQIEKQRELERQREKEAADKEKQRERRITLVGLAFAFVLGVPDWMDFLYSGLGDVVTIMSLISLLVVLGLLFWLVRSDGKEKKEGT